MASAIGAALFEAGWCGTERIWYLRAFRRLPIDGWDLWRFTWAFCWRFVRLGLLVFLPPFLLVMAAFFVYRNATVYAVLIVAVFLLLDFALTFVTPALAYTTRSVRGALRIGLKTIASAWPASAPYVFVPPLLIMAATRILPASVLPPLLSLVVGAVATLLSLLCKGITAAFYLRCHEVNNDGAAWLADPMPESTMRDWGLDMDLPPRILIGPAEVYSAPNLDAPIIAWLTSAERVGLASDGDEGDFYKVLLPGSQVGFVPKRDARLASLRVSDHWSQ